MCQQLEQSLARYCAPTLAGIKPASLIACGQQYDCDLEAELVAYRALNAAGIYFQLLHREGRRVLLYVYRPQQLAAHLAQAEARQILAQAGYPATAELAALLAYLEKRIQHSGEFPHEIGLFLGYPPADVAGFLEHGGKNYRCQRYWKVYGDVEAAEKMFARYDSCCRAVCRHLASGVSIMQMFRPRNAAYPH